MSTRRTDYGVTFEVHSGVTKVLTATIIDPDSGEAKDLSDTNVYTTGTAIIYKPDGTQIGSNMAVTFIAPRTAGDVSFTVTSSSHTNILNSGNWIGLIKFYNVSSVLIDEQMFNINI